LDGFGFSEMFGLKWLKNPEAIREVERILKENLTDKN
jgi:hypothetical protein